MRLKLIKLAGFKSFVEPTTLHLAADMTAVVGPNGCGKSNVIDAVRWVLGESSARHLRGENMTDVIFNGSTNRPVHSRASVELVFDNPHQRVPGEFGRFTEIAVRREVYRDGTNHYLINGQKCRRKDVTDLFLGTGLGPRSYAIIEQGTVSRLVESRPADLKLFLEEAAGVSRYKERRRETEQRIRHTRENLERLGDIRSELGERLQHLKAQAETAEHYGRLKARSREARSHLMGAELWGIEQRLGEIKGQTSEQERQLAELDARRTHDEAQALIMATRRQELQAEQAERQQQIFLGGQAIARLEQQSLHHSEQQRQWQSRQGSLAERKTELQAKLAEELAAHEQAEQGQERASGELELAQAQQDEAQLRQQEGAAQQEEARRQRDSWQQQYGELQREVSALRSRLAHGQEMQARTRLARFRLEEELAQHGDEPTAADPAPLEQLRSDAKARLQELEAKRDELVELRQQHKESWHAAESRHREALARLQTLDALLGERSAEGLVQQLILDERWAPALDKVLGHWLTATVGDSWFDASQGRWIGQAPSARPGTLACWVKGTFLPDFLNAIYTAESRAEAQSRVTDLSPGESIITPEGIWIGSNWIDAGGEQRLGTLAMLAERDRLAQESTEQSAQLARQDAALQQLQLALQDHQATLSQAQTEFAQADATWQQARQLWLQQEGRLTERTLRQQQIVTEREALTAQLEEELAAEQEGQEQLQLAQARLEEWQEQGEQWQQAQEQTRARLAELDSQLARARQQREERQALLQRLTLELENRSKMVALHQGELARLEQESLELAAPQSDAPVDLAPLLAAQRELDAAQLRTHQALAELDTRWQALDAQRQQDHKTLVTLQETLAQLRLERERLLTRRQALHEQLEELGIRFVDLDPALLLQADRSKLRQEIQALEEQVGALGAINLAALQEYEEARTRADYLENQCQDLEAALETLEQAIRRIDRETQIRFRDTFDKVNEDLKSLFPKVFGGGSAWLELTSDDLLEAGVTIMARPPGKKNATIALLSGGEKALTALALVFAIFRLNPAPFCMLDEVDAPLDEVNVGRFCSLVKEMSSTVQFVYISHNKVSMEMAEQLVGVTMQEPGVSRIVSVDIGEAVALAEQN
ncbi:condensin subunit Smc [Aeromonas sp. RU39B]|uniref:AAA family ATPase n=1 Tax=Aeromonas sp. RU39B TaxID=1907416 RepID=UPI0009562972|nr:AAA family ATPase [Aeromonas sp. RU39B]SIQ56611.1 condensin subunit Smc [Aeromonas sp. RU39B]